MTKQALAAQQTTMLRAIAEPDLNNATNLIAVCAYTTLASGVFSTQFMQKRGLQAYRANAHALAARALQAPYPVIEQMLGSEVFAMLARDLWHDHPPRLGDLAQWGGVLAAWMQQAPALAELITEHPYLYDVACTEWALHQCATAPDTSLDAASFALLTSHEAWQVHLRMAPGAQVVPSAYPVASIVLAHSAGEASVANALHHLSQQNAAETALVWRQGYVPQVRALANTEVAFVSAAVTGLSLQAALDAAHADFDFSAWLSIHVHSGLVVGAQVHAD